MSLVKFTRLRILLITAGLFASTVSSGQLKFVNEFLNIGVGARAHGMFGSVVANVQDGTAAYWNPAGLTGITSALEVNAMHADWFGDVANYEYISVAKTLNPAKRSVGAFTVIRMGIDEIPNTLNLIGPDGSVDYSRVTTFSAADYAFLASYARAMDQQGNFSIGGSIKVIRRSIGSFASAWGFGADVGVMWRKPKYSIGISARDITTTFNAWSFNLTEEEKQVFQNTGNEIPVSSSEVTLPRIILGAAYFGKIKKIDYTLELDLNISTNGTEAGILSSDKISLDPTFGAEFSYDNLVFLRMGVGNIQRVINEVNASKKDFELQPNVGLGLKLGRLKVDYALTNIGSVSGVLVSHIFSLSINIDAKKP